MRVMISTAVVTAVVTIAAVVVVTLGSATARFGVVYDDSLHWDNWSWDTDLDLSSNSAVFEGSNAMTVTFERAWAGASFAIGSYGSFDTSAYTHLQFAIHASRPAIPSTKVAVHDQTGNAIAEVNAHDYSQSVGNGWHLVTIPLSHLHAEDSEISRISVQEAEGTVPPSFHIDALSFMNQF